MANQILLFKSIEVETDNLKNIVRAVVPYIIRDVDDEVSAINDFQHDYDFDNIPFNSASVTGKAGDRAYFIDVVYQSPNYNFKTSKLEDNEVEITYECTAKQIHVTQSLKTITCKNSSNKTVDFGGAIGVDKDGNTQGVDIMVPASSFTVKKQISYREFIIKRVGYSYITAKVNSDSFFGYEAGEVLYNGFTASHKGSTHETIVNITHQFVVSPNEKDKQVASWKVDKLGHQYLWVRQIEKYDDAKKMRVMTPDVIAIEQVYETASFATLGLNGGK